MNEHRKIKKLLVDFALRQLPKQAEVEVRAHLAECSQCTHELKRLEALLMCTERMGKRCVDAQVCDSAKRMIFAALPNRQTGFFPAGSGVYSQFVWRKVMKHPITKLALTLTLVIAGVVGIDLLSAPSQAYGMRDVPEMVQQARTIHIKGWQCANVQRGLYEPDVVQPGQPETRALLEYWIDMETGCMRCTQPGNVRIDRSRVTAPVYTTIYDGEYIMIQNEECKEVRYSKLTPYQQLLRKRKNSLAVLQRMLVSLEIVDSFEKTDQERIKGNVFDVWQAEIKAPAWGGAELRIKSWVSPKTGYVGRVEIWMTEGAGDWYQSAELAEIEYNVPIPARTFITEAPSGYTSANTKENAYIRRLFQNRNRVGDQTIASYASFTLNDGSVILGWSCTTGWPDNDRSSDSYQAAVFNSLVVGGQLPALPIEFYTVSPIGEDPGVEYHGRHLSYTRKGSMFHEWGLYVPERRLDKYYGRLNYSLFYKGNSKEMNGPGAFTLGQTGDIWIHTQRDFDLFVLGAMAELSDESKAPTDVTYERVLQLASQIRNQLQKEKHESRIGKARGS